MTYLTRLDPRNLRAYVPHILRELDVYALAALRYLCQFRIENSKTRPS